MTPGLPQRRAVRGVVSAFRSRCGPVGGVRVGVGAVCSGVFEVDDRVLPLQVRACAGGCAGIGKPEPGADLRPGTALGEGGGDRLGEEFLAHLSGRGESAAVVVSVLLLRPVLSVGVDWLIRPGIVANRGPVQRRCSPAAKGGAEGPVRCESTARPSRRPPS